VIISLIFFALYQGANPLFAENMKWLSLDFVSINWVVFTLGGLVITYGIFYHQRMSFLESWENELPLTNEKITEAISVRVETERLAGIVLFILLNVMLAVLNIGDISSLGFNGKLPEGITHSDFVHSGVGNIIFSIIIAVSLLMFLFRRDFVMARNTPLLKLLVIVWVLQTIMMLISTSIRNYYYIQSYSLTYKRIGVFVWLALAVIGVVITLIKILRERSNWFLIRRNVAVWLTVLSVSSLISWDVMVTRFNLENKPLDKVDFVYLFNLSDANIPELQAVARQNDFALLKEKLLHNGSRVNFEKELHFKVLHFLKDYTTSWQSWDQRDKKITSSLLAQ
jgi:hypothetical protein